LEIEKARKRVQEYIDKCEYTYKVDDIVESYLKYWVPGYYVSYTTKDCIVNLTNELQIITGVSK